MELQLRCRGVIGVDALYYFHPQVKQMFPVSIFSLANHFDLDEFFLYLLFGIEDSVEFGTLMACPFLIDECTPAIEDVYHLAPASVQVVFDHGPCSIQYGGYLRDLKLVNLLEE